MKQKRSNLQKREGVQATLEGYRRFDYDYIPFGTNWFAPGADYNYRGSKLQRAGTQFFRFITLTLGTLLIKIAYGAKVTGKENLKELKGKGAVCVCNHFSYFDTLFVRAAAGHFRSYHTMAPQNNRANALGWLLRHGGVLPLSPNITAMRNFNLEVERLLQSGKIVNFYAEQAMWTNYQKPRPMKDGAVYYAVKYQVPLLPIFCTFQKSKRGAIKKLRIHVLPPVYANEELPKKQRLAQMKAEAEEAWKECYEQAYGVPLTYLPDRRKKS